eukprot:gene5440-biopygen14760
MTAGTPARHPRAARPTVLPGVGGAAAALGLHRARDGGRSTAAPTPRRRQSRGGAARARARARARTCTRAHI